MTTKTNLRKIAKAGLAGMVGLVGLAGFALNAKADEKGFGFRALEQVTTNTDENYESQTIFGLSSGKYDMRQSFGQLQDNIRFTETIGNNSGNHYSYSLFNLLGNPQNVFRSSNVFLPSSALVYGGTGENSSGDFDLLGIETNHCISKELSIRLSGESYTENDIVFRKFGGGLTYRPFEKLSITVSDDHIFSNLGDTNQFYTGFMYELNKSHVIGGAFVRRDLPDGSNTNLVRGVASHFSGRENLEFRAFGGAEWNEQKDFKKIEAGGILTFGPSRFSKGSSQLLIGDSLIFDNSFALNNKYGLKTEYLPPYDRILGTGAGLAGNICKTQIGENDSLLVSGALLGMVSNGNKEIGGKIGMSYLIDDSLGDKVFLEADLVARKSTRHGTYFIQGGISYPVKDESDSTKPTLMLRAGVSF